MRGALGPPSRVTDEHGLIVGSEVSYLKGKVFRGKAGAYNVALVKMLFDHEQVNADFLYRWLNGSLFQEHLKRLSRSAQNGFNKSDMAHLSFRWPPVDEQKRMAQLIDASYAWIDKIAKEHNGAARLIDRLYNSILAKAFRGELVPQDPSDEPVSELLRRILAERAVVPAKANRRRGQRGAQTALS